MGNQTSITFNEIQELLQALREATLNSDLNQEISDAIQDAKSLIDQAIQNNVKLRLLSTCMETDSVDQVEELMKNRQVKVTDFFDHLQVTALHLAAYYGSAKCIQYLSSLDGFRVDVRTRVGDSPILLALLNAPSDSSALKLVRILQSLHCNCSESNNNQLVPLSVAIHRNFTECIKFLLRTTAINLYDYPELLLVLKLSLVNDQRALVDTILSKLSKETALELIAENFDESTLTPGMLRLLERIQVILRAQESADVSCTDNGFKSLLIQADNVPLPRDSAGKVLLLGDIVRTPSTGALREALAAPIPEDRLRDVADSVASILEVLADGNIYIDIYNKNITATMKPHAVKLASCGQSVILSDSSSAKVGSFVKVTGKSNWKSKLPGEAGGSVGVATTGKTGLVVRVQESIYALVQFAWGVRRWFQAENLVASSADDMEIYDYRNSNWIGIGSTVNINVFRAAFFECQQRLGLPYKGDYDKLPWKYAIVKRIYVKAFISTLQKVEITYDGKDYDVNVDCLRLVDFVKDRFGIVVKIGDHVRIFENEKIVKHAQRPQFGGWVEGLGRYLNQVGKLEGIRPALPDANGVMIKVEFAESKGFYFNPRNILAVSKDEIVVAVKTPEPKPPLHPSISIDEMERVNRKDLYPQILLGEGSYGCVWKGVWQKDGKQRTVAIKKIKIDVTETLDLPTIMKEAEIQYSLSHHPNIVSLFGVNFEADVWMVLEFIDGSNLFDMIFPEDSAPIRLTHRRALKYSLDMCKAIAFIHEKGYVHADIKSLNMMIEKSTDKLYVLDFGITRFLGSVSLMDFATQYTLTPEGTLYYIPPECIRTDDDGRYKKPKFPADVWALGAVIFEVFTSSHLGKTSMDFLYDKLLNRDAHVKQSLSKLPSFVDSIVSRALEFNPALRPTAKEMADFFQTYNANQVPY